MLVWACMACMAAGVNNLGDCKSLFSAVDSPIYDLLVWLSLIHNHWFI